MDRVSADLDELFAASFIQNYRVTSSFGEGTSMTFEVLKGVERSNGDAIKGCSHIVRRIWADDGLDFNLAFRGRKSAVQIENVQEGGSQVNEGNRPLALVDPAPTQSRRRILR